MKRIKKRIYSYFLLVFFLGVIIIFIVFLPHLFKKTNTQRTVSVFGISGTVIKENFPLNEPNFTAVIGAIKPASLHQQSITVYKLEDGKKETLFKRSFYADGFRGNELTYTLSSSSAEIIQRGYLGSLGCTAGKCKLPWNNYYIWDAKQKTFVLNNVKHKNIFQELLATYQRIDKNACSIVGGKILPKQEGLSFTELYQKFPTAPYYCSKTQGIVPSNIILFLSAEKALQMIVSGENIGSGDIRTIQI